MTNGGRKSIASNNFNTAANPMFDNPPGCYMYRQGNFVAKAGRLPRRVLADLDNTVGVFPMPGKTAEDKPVLGGGDLAGHLQQGQQVRQEARQVPRVQGVTGRTGTRKTGAWISPRTDFDDEPATRRKTLGRIAQVAYQSTEFVFDGSDQMPGEVGSGSFWRDMTAVDQRPGGREDGTGQHREQLAADAPAGVPGGPPSGTRRPSRAPPASTGGSRVSRSSTR